MPIFNDTSSIVTGGDFKLSTAFAADNNRKINLGLGTYRTADELPLFEC